MDILIIALNSDELTLATFSSKKGGIRFLSAERHTLEGKENELAQILAGFPPSKEQRKVVLSLPPSMLFMRETEFPITDCAKVRELLPMELKGETALDSDTLIFEALPMMNGKFLAIWAQSKDLLDKINAFKEYGLEPEIVTSTIFHWNRLAPKDKVVAITDGHAIAAYNKGIPIFFRVLPLGSAAEEVSKTISVLECSCNIGIDEIISYTRINSETPSDPVMTPILAEAFGDDNHAAHDLATIYSLAFAVSKGKMINLRRGSLLYTADNEKLKLKLRFTLSLAAIVVILLIAESAIRYNFAKRDLATVQQSIKTIYQDVFPTRKKPTDEVAELRSEIKRLSSARTTSNILKLLKDISEAKGDDVAGIYETEIDGSEVRLKGEAKTFESANDFKQRAGKILDQAEVSEIKSRSDGSVTFSFRGKMKGVSK